MSPDPPFAGLWVRIKAFGLDYLILASYIVVMTGAVFVAGRLAPATMASLFAERISAQVTVFVILTLPVSLYFILLEASPRQGTWGKQRLGLKVERADGARLSPARSVARTVCKFVPWALTHTLIWQSRFTPDSAAAWSTWGFVAVWVLIVANAVSVLLDPRHRALYDLVAGTVVLYRAPLHAAAMRVK